MTFCDLNAFTSKEGQDFVLSLVYSSECHDAEGYQLICAQYLAPVAATDPQFGDENRKLLGLNLAQITCLYNGSNCNNDLHWYWSYKYGNCFQFNAGLNYDNNNIDTRMTNGIANSLTIYINDFTNSNFTSFGNEGGLGIVVFVHNNSLKPRELEEGVYIKPGEKSFIGVKRTFVENAPLPYTQCQDLTSYSSVLYDFIINSNRNYRQKDCFDLCKQQRILVKCECYYLQFDNPFLSSNLLNQTRPCFTPSDIICVENAFYQVDVVKCASEYCPLECESILYDTSVSSIIFPTVNDLSFSNIPLSVPYEELRLKYLTFNIYYSQLEYTLLQEIPAINLATLISNIGGSMSIIVGVSFFTLLEIVELFFLLLSVLLCSRTNSNKTSP